MYTWTLTPASTFCFKSFIDTAMVERRLNDRALSDLRRLIRQSDMRTSLRQMLERLADFAHSNSQHRNAISAVVEFVAGCEYAKNDVSVGKLRQLRAHFANPSSALAVRFLRRFCRRALRTKAHHHKNLWFNLRVRCMDAYTICHMMDCTDELCIYYGGRAHTKNVSRFFRQRMSHVARNADTPILEKLERISRECNILHFEVLKNGESDRCIVLLGENHATTQERFGSLIVDELRAMCHNITSTTFLIEKHISNQRDNIQRDLMCNQPQLALHKSRCDAFVENGFATCPSLKIIPVDNRHTDMGFLRIEIFDVWHDDHLFRQAAIDFQQASLESMIAFCDTVLACHGVG